jgi:hypothetical protein
MTPTPDAPRPRRYFDGLVSIPYDLLTDATLGTTAKLVALAMSSLAYGTTTCAAPIADIGRACGLKSRCVQEGIAALAAAGWVARGEKAKESSQRRIVVLCWLLPDDYEGIVPQGFATQPRRRRLPGGPLPLFPREGGAR